MPPRRRGRPPGVRNRPRRRRLPLRRNRGLFTQLFSPNVHKFIAISTSIQGSETATVTRTLNGPLGATSLTFPAALASPAYFTMYWNLNGSPLATDLSTLFDSYRIMGVQVQIEVPFSGANVPGNANSVSNLKLYAIKDYDDSALPANLYDLCQYKKCKQIYFTPDKRVAKFNIKPQVYIEDNLTTSLQIRDPWIDMADFTVAYNGMKFGLEWDVVGNRPDFDIKFTAKLFLECKGQR